ncbi:transglycosylase SLT domain-containing protein [Streptomyces thermoalcalitolerans]|uniref:Transglycosylase SLT domain-containing protein n=1 Tax=Streptomyces thermoalcalitolerans TaxID=65605 RepID=A0ABP3YTX4_9ACTN
MPAHLRARALGRALTTRRKCVAAGTAVLGAATLAVSAVPSQAQPATGAATVTAAPVQLGAQPIKGVKAAVTDQLAGESVKIQAIEARQQAARKAVAEKAAVRKAVARAAEKAVAGKAAAQKAVVTKARATHRAEQAVSRSAARPQAQKAAAPTRYPNNLDGWIRESLAIMRKHNIPGTYQGLYRNIMRESSGNPYAINNWDINARNGIPSKGLLQVIPPTFRAYHVPGTSWNIYDPVANITAAANYAAHRYGSIDNVYSAY